MTNTTTGTTTQPPRGLHAICEDARRGQCDYCSAMPGEACVVSGAGPDGYHVARFTWARASALISVLDVGAVLRTVADTPFDGTTVIYDTVGGTEDDTVSSEARMVGEVRAILAGFDWETGDRQYALEAIDRIVNGDDGQADEDEDDHWAEYNYACSSCGGQIGMFIGYEGWRHYRGEGTVASPVEFYDAGHEATFGGGITGGES